uniref:Uncharacterized protein n=1 Tax=Lynx canadensis TaxID=61383 RepID=A0A667FG60_LYNCA
MFSRKKRELMKTPSISKKNRAGSPSPQPLGGRPWGPGSRWEGAGSGRRWAWGSAGRWSGNLGAVVPSGFESHSTTTGPKG